MLRARQGNKETRLHVFSERQNADGDGRDPLGSRSSLLVVLMKLVVPMRPNQPIFAFGEFSTREYFFINTLCQQNFKLIIRLPNRICIPK